MAEGRFDIRTHSHTDTLRALPPSESALFQHLKGAAYVSGYLCGKADKNNPELPDIQECGWVNQQSLLIPFWTEKTQTEKGAYKTAFHRCQCGDKNGCLKQSCGCKATKCISYCRCRGKCRKDITREMMVLKMTYKSQVIK